MSQVVERLAEITGFRDRDLLDVTLVGALRDLLQPQSVAMYRFIGEGIERRWITRARLDPGDTVATADPLWQDPHTLPLLESQPVRYACLLRQEPMTIGGTPAMALFPIASDREPVGVVEITTPEPMDWEQVRLVTSILRVYRNFQVLLDYSERDTLTGLLNRKTFDDNFMRLATAPVPAPDAAVPPGGQRRQGGEGAAWLGVIDIDHFKRVNDGFGHLIGDEVLLLLSRLMRSTFRYNDRLYRFGGEEFVVLMRSAGADNAALAFERLRANVERYTFPQVGQITVSIGFTAVRATDTPASAFGRADRAVYHAKQQGRNRVAHHAALVASGALEESATGDDVELF
jgi:diguanylate cyclase (GGDEF)-like protein